MPAQNIDRRVEMTPVEVATVGFRPYAPLKDFRHRRWIDDGEGRAFLDRHVHPAVLPEFVAKVGERFYRVEMSHGFSFCGILAQAQ